MLVRENHSSSNALRMRRPGSQLMKHFAAGLLGMFLAHPVHASDGVEPQALKAIFPGNFEAVVEGYTVSFTALRDGSLVGRYASVNDSGRWSLRRGELCIMLSSWFNGRTECARVVYHGGWYRADGVLFRKAKPSGSVKSDLSEFR